MDNNAEYIKLMNSIKDKSESTKKNYRLQYKKLFNLINENQNGEKLIQDTSQEKVIQLAKKEKSLNTTQALVNIAVVVRKLYEMNTKQLTDFRDNNRNHLIEEIKEKNVILAENLPSYE